MALATPAEGFSQYTGVSLFKRGNIYDFDRELVYNEKNNER